MSTREKVALGARLREEAYKEWLNQPLIQFPLRPDTQIGMTTTIVVLHHTTMEEIKRMLVWLITYGIRLPWRKCYYAF